MRRKEDKKAAIPQAPGGSTQLGPDRTSISGTRTTDADVVEPKSSQYENVVDSSGVPLRAGNKRVRSLERPDSTGDQKRKQLRASRSPSPAKSGVLGKSSRHDLQEAQRPSDASLNSRYRALVSVVESLPAQLMDL